MATEPAARVAGAAVRARQNDDGPVFFFRVGAGTLQVVGASEMNQPPDSVPLCCTISISSLHFPVFE